MKKSISIFLIFFLIFSFFAQWNDAWDFQKLTAYKGIVERNSLNMDPYANSTPIRYEYKNHYYSQSYFGQSLLYTSIYSFSKLTFPFMPENLFEESKTIHYQKLGRLFRFETSPFISYQRLLTTIFLSSLFGGISVLLMYKILSLYSLSEKVKTLTILAYGLGSSIFPYSTAVYAYIPCTTLLLLTFYLVKNFTKNENGNKKLLFLAGITGGFAVITYIVSIIPLIFICLCMVKKKLQYIYFIPGFILSILPKIFYHLSIFGRIYAPPVGSFIHHNFETVYSGLAYPNYIPQILLRMLFYPYRGLFFYYPVLLLIIPGIFYMWKGGKREIIIALGTLLSMLLIRTLSRFVWWGHFAFGPRVLILSIPFLFIIVAHTIKKLNKKLIIVLVFLCISINFLGLQVWEGGINKSKLKNRMQDWKPIGNPISSRYIPLLIKNGPRSMLFENLILRGKISILNAPQICKSFDLIPRTEIPITELNNGILILKIPFLNLFFLLGLLFLIWHKKFLKYFKISKNINIILIIIFIIILCISFLGIKKCVMGRGWVPTYNDGGLGTLHKMKQNGTIYFYSPKQSSYKLKTIVSSLSKTKHLKIHLNGEKIKTLRISENRSKSIKVKLSLNSGINVIKFEAVEGCTIPKPSQCNVRCLSFSFNKTELIKLNDDL